jgi:site-specific DNA recombinase
MSSGKLAAVYCRVSTEEQALNTSIKGQTDACLANALRYGYTVPPHLIFRDVGFSGAYLDRPALDRMRDLILSGVVSAVFVLDSDRLSRSLAHLLLLQDEMLSHDVRLFIGSESVENDPEGKAFAQMRGVFSELERAKIRERMRRGQVARSKEGRIISGAPPLGYAYVNKAEDCTCTPVNLHGHFEVNGKEKALVERIYQMYLDGNTIRGIATILSLEKVPTKIDRCQKANIKRLGYGEWNVSSIHGILTNEAYLGRLYWNRTRWKETDQNRRKKHHISTNNRRKKTTELRDKSEWIPLIIPVIITEEMFRAVQDRLQHTKKINPRNRRFEYLFCGAVRLRCGQCGTRSMSGYVSSNKRRYRCTSQMARVNLGRNCKGSVAADVLEPRVWALVKNLVDDPEYLPFELARRKQGVSRNLRRTDEELASIVGAIQSTENEFDRIIFLYSKGGMTTDKYFQIKAAFDERLQGLRDQYEKTKAHLNHEVEAQAHIETAIEFLQRVKAEMPTYTISEQRRLLEALNAEVVYTSKDDVRLRFMVPFGGDEHPEVMGDIRFTAHCGSETQHGAICRRGHA